MYVGLKSRVPPKKGYVIIKVRKQTTNCQGGVKETKLLCVLAREMSSKPSRRQHRALSDTAGNKTQRKNDW